MYPHLADLAATANIHFRLAISGLKNLINSAAKLIALNFSGRRRTLSHLPSPVFCVFHLSPVSCILSPVFCILSPVSCLLSPASRLPSPVSCLLSHISCLLSQVSRALSAADLIHSDLADLAVLWSKLADLGNLAVLTRLADLAD